MVLNSYLEANLHKDFQCKIKSSLDHLKGFGMMEHATVKATYCDNLRTEKNG